MTKNFYLLSLLSLTLLGLAGTTANAQSYVTAERKGSSIPPSSVYVYNTAQGVTKLLTNKDDALSSVRTIPFKFSFFGEEVTQYKASTNGFITFDVSQDSSYPVRADISSADAPNNSIFGFWTDINIAPENPNTTEAVRSWTIGSAPERVHIIQWFAVTSKAAPASTGNELVFSIRLYESGEFDIINDYVGTQVGNLMGAVGAKNADGSQSMNFGKSSNYSIPSVPNLEQAPILLAIPKLTTNANDAQLTGVYVPRFMSKKDNNQIAGRLFNRGSSNITSFTFSYTTDEGKMSKTMSANLAPGQDMVITHPDAIDLNVGDHNFNVEVNMVNGTSADVTMNNTASTSTLVHNGANGDYKVVVEEFTGAWCGWCPDGHVELAKLKEANPDAIIVGVHQGNAASDKMANSLTNSLSSRYAAGYPSAVINREFVREFGQQTFSRNLWDDVYPTVETRSYKPVKLAVDVKSNEDQTELTITPSVEVLDIIPSDWNMRMNVYIIQNEVSGNGQGWDQVNYLSGHQAFPGHPFQSQPNPVPNYLHKHVLASSLTGTYGDAKFLGDRAIGAKSASEYKFTKPADDAAYDFNNLTVVAFLSSYNPSTKTDDLIITGEEVMVQTVGVKQAVDLHTTALALYPNPAASNVNMTFTLEQTEDVQVKVYDRIGKLVDVAYTGKRSAGENNLMLNVENLASGMYFVSLQAGAQVSTASLIVR